MDAARLARLRTWLTRPIPLIGGWLRRHAVERLAREGSADAARVLAEVLVAARDGRWATELSTALARFRAPAAIDAVCAIWASTRHPGLATLLAGQDWLAQAPPKVKALSALRAGRTTVFEDCDAAVAVALAEACNDADPALATAARKGILVLENPSAINALCERWAETRDPAWADAILERRYLATRPVSVRVLSALWSSQLEVATEGGAEVVAPLLAAATDRDQHLAARAREALRQLRMSAARDALCQQVIDGDVPAAREAALAAGYAPKDPQARALFYFLTEQWTPYEGLDFDQRLLAAAYTTADRKLRARIAEKVRRAGRGEWVAVVAQGRQDRRLAELTNEEWETTRAVLTESARWPELWQLAQTAPLDWSLRFLLQLRAVGWKPSDRDQAAGWANLVAAASACAPEGSADRVQPPPALGRLMRLQRRLEGHTGPIACLALSEDGQTLATAGNDNTARLWSLSQPGPPLVLEGHRDWVACMAWDPLGGRLATGGRDGTVRLWSAADGKQLAQLGGHAGGVRCLRFAPGGPTLVTGGDDRAIRTWRVPSGQALKALEGHSDVVSCLALSRDGRLLASGSYDQTACLWRLPEGDLAARLPGHKALINDVAFAPGGQWLATASKDRCLLLWGIPAGQRLTRIKGHKDDVNCLAVSPDGALLASGSWDNTVRLWRPPDGELFEVFGSTGTMDGHAAWVTCLGFSSDGGVLASGSLDCTVRLWNVPERKPIATLNGHTQRVSCLALLPDGRTLVTGSWDGTACVWQSELDRLRRCPIAQTTLDDLGWVNESRGDPRLSEAERAWLGLLAALIQWRRRHDIFLGEEGAISVGEFDIEIEG
jgi:WD40 repeat protein